MAISVVTLPDSVSHVGNEVAAIAAIDVVNAHYGCPMAGVDTWTTYQAWGNGWAIMADESLVVVLGEGDELEKYLTATEGLEHPTPTASTNEEFGGYFRRSTSMNSDGLYTIESNPNPVLKDGTILTAENHEQYDGAEGWQWYAAGDPVEISMTPTRWESVKNWFKRIF